MNSEPPAEPKYRTLFMMRECNRQILIEEHLFYYEQACQRLLSQFENIEQEADIVTAKFSRYFNPDQDDPHVADERGYEFFKLLCDMRRQTQLSVLAGMYQNLDKQLRQWLNTEIQFWHKGEHVKKNIWSVNFVQIIELLENQGWMVKSADYFKVLDACRLVVNVYKHGDGNSLENLKQKYPAYLVNPFEKYSGELTNLLSNDWKGDHKDLRVNNTQIEAFSNSIVKFWSAIPEKIRETNTGHFPDWFEKALKEDCGRKKD